MGVESLGHWEVKKVTCSKNSSFALLENGELYSWGSNKYGMLGSGSSRDSEYLPQRMQY